MNITSLSRRGRSASASAASVLAVAVLALGLTACGDDTADKTGADQGTSASRPGIETTAQPETGSTTEAEPATEPTTETTPDTGTEPTTDAAPEGEGSSDAQPAALSDLGPRDPEIKLEFPGEMVFDDESSAYSDGTTLTVTTPAGEKVSAELPTNGGGYISVRPTLLGDAGVGYVITQTGGEYLNTYLAVLDKGELYFPEQSDDVVFGQFAGEGPFFETYSTDGGQHLVTHIEDAPSGMSDEYYEWTVEDRRMVPTLLS